MTPGAAAPRAREDRASPEASAEAPDPAATTGPEPSVMLRLRANGPRDPLAANGLSAVIVPSADRAPRALTAPAGLSRREPATGSSPEPAARALVHARISQIARHAAKRPGVRRGRTATGRSESRALTGRMASAARKASSHVLRKATGRAVILATSRRAVSSATSRRAASAMTSVHSAAMIVAPSVRAAPPDPSAAPSCRGRATRNGLPQPRRPVVSSASPR